jgi:type IV pilus assembly protein PilW
MTLVELMVGMAVGLFVIVIAVTVFVSTRTLHSVGAASTRMTENSRLAMDVLQTDLRNAGYAGCRPLLNEPPVNVLNAGDGGFIVNAAGIQGHRGTGSGFSPALIAPLAAMPAASGPLPNSDIISVRVAAEMNGLGVTAPMTSEVAAPRVAANAPGNALAMGDIVLVASCKAGAIFQVTEADPVATGVLSHAIGGSIAPGNATDNLRQRFRSDATVYKLQTRHYYVAPSTRRPGTNSMWRLTVPGPAQAEEVASGVDRLVMTYGIDGTGASGGSGTQNIDRYVSADSVGDWEKVIAVRLDMLSATAKDGVARARQTVQFAGAAVIASDRRLRTVLSEVVTVRNGAP